MNDVIDDVLQMNSSLPSGQSKRPSQLNDDAIQEPSSQVNSLAEQLGGSTVSQQHIKLESTTANGLRHCTIMNSLGYQRTGH